MSDTIGNVIESRDGLTDRIPDTNADVSTANANSERIAGAEIRDTKSETINGYDASDPRTERISSGSSTDGIRLTKAGKPDRRGRGNRWRGESDTTETTKSTLGVALNNISIAGLLLGIHAMAARILETPELKLEKTEADELSTAVQNVAKEYNHVLNPKTAAWIQLSVTCGAIYGTRIVAISMNKNKVRKPPVNGAPAPPTYTAPDPPVPHGDLN